MVAAALVDGAIKAAAEFLGVLEEHLPVFAAFWYFDPDLQGWRFVVGSNYVDEMGPTEAYRRVREAMDRWIGRDELSLEDVNVVGKYDPILDVLIALPRTGLAGIGGPYRAEGVYIYKNALPRLVRRR